MRIAHFIRVGPHQSGMYETTRELVAAELNAGFDAFAVDTSFIDNKTDPTRTYSRDRGIDIVPVHRVGDADIHVMHSIIPKDLYGKAPVLMALHGAPEYVFYGECNGHHKGDRGFSTVLSYDTDEITTCFMTFWKRHVPVWEAYLGKEIHYVPACVDLDGFSPDGSKYEPRTKGEINIGICESWRTDYWKDPFRVLPGVCKFAKECEKDVKLHIFSVPHEETRDILWDRAIKAVQRNHDCVGDLNVRTSDVAAMYRGMDMTISLCCEESRTVRESLACGVPVVTAKGAGLSDFEADFMFPDSVTQALSKCLNAINTEGNNLATRVRKRAEECFNPKQTMETLRSLFYSVCKRN